MTRVLRPCAFLVVTAVCTLSFLADAEGQTTLRWKLEKGQVFNRSVNQVMKMAATFGDRNIDTSMSQTIDSVWTIGNVDPEGAAEITEQNTRIRMKMEGAIGGFEFDSDSDEEPTGIGAMLAPALVALAKSKVTMKMTALGEVQEVEVSPETIEALKSLPMAGQMGGMFSEKGLVAMIKQGVHALPEKAVQKGDTWTAESNMEMMASVGKLDAKTIYTYQGPEEVDGKTLERIDVAIEMKITPAEGGEAQITVKEQKAEGVLYFDNKAGRLSHSEINQDMTTEVTVAGNTIEQKLHTTTTTRLTPDEQ